MKLNLKKKNLANLSKDLTEMHSEQTKQVNGGVAATLKGCAYPTTHTYTKDWGNCQLD